MTVRTITGKNTPSYVPIEIFLSVSIPTPSGIHFIIALTGAGNTSAGIVAPENKSIGKYKTLVTILIAFVVRHTPATNNPMENIESMVSNQTRMKTSTFPLIRYPTITAAIVSRTVEKAATIPLDIISQANILIGEHGLQYILLRIPWSLKSTIVIG